MFKKIIVICYLLFTYSLYSQDKKRIDSLTYFATTTTQDSSKAKTYCLLCYEYRKFDTIKSRQYGEHGLQIATREKLESTQAQCLSNLAFMYSENSDYFKSINYNTKALALREKLGDNKKVAKSLIGIGTCYTKLGKYDLAIKYFFDALKISQQSNNKKGIYQAYGAIGGAYYLEGDNDQSLKYLEKTLIIAKEIGDSNYIANAYMNVGIQTSDYKKALEYLHKSLEINEKLNDKEQLEANYINIGLVYSRINNFETALNYYNKGLKIATDYNIKEDAAILLTNISFVYIKLKNYPLALKYAEQSLAIARELNLKDNIKDASENLAIASSKLGYFEKAFEYQKLNSDIKDSLYTEDRQNTIVEMQTKYDVDTKEKENQLLNQKVELQKLDSNQQRIILYSVSLFAILLLSLAFIIFRGYRQKKNANQVLERQNIEITSQKEIIEMKNKEIVDSINYAQLIQQAVLPSIEEFACHLKNSFVLFKPKDIVSGDFYWMNTIEKFTFFTAVDCTGHGVPGGFMSMLGSSLLNEVVNEKKILEPADVLDMMRIKLITSLKQKGSRGENKDGMDMTLCRLNESRTELVYAAANNPLWLIRNGKLIEYPADKQPVGISTDHAKQFTQQKIALQKDDCIYIFTDGYADQFGGPKGKKFKYKPLQELLIQNNTKSMLKQNEILQQSIEDWKGSLEQVDDILIIGIKI